MADLPGVVVAMSGGVDSSVAAALLVKQGYPVTGMMLRLWSEPGSKVENRCCAPEAMVLARRVAEKLSIPFYVIPAQDVFYTTVIANFITELSQGLTPNPCLVCNRLIRWGLLWEQAAAIGANYLATGHYARLHRDESGVIQLLRGVDARKDQSYVLHVLNQQQLEHTMLPLGEFTKPQVRQLARDFALPVAERPDSQDLCFLGEEDYRSFLLRRAPFAPQPGPILDRNGQVLGEHPGLAFFTIGQRKGLGLSSPHPLYVLEKDLKKNALIVGPGSELGGMELVVHNVNWISGQPPTGALRAQIKIRYKANDAWGTIIPLADRRAAIQFDESLRDITPGQSAVFYASEVCLGGGEIAPVHKTDLAITRASLN